MSLPWRTNRNRRKSTGNADHASMGARAFHVTMIRGDVMDSYTKEELEEALQIVSLIISRCEKHNQNMP